MFLYDKNGKGHKVPHAVDRKEWLATGDYFAENPKAKKETKKDNKKEDSLLD